MMLLRLAAAAIALFAGPVLARAHPHIWIDATAKVSFSGPDVIGIEHAWIFDEAFSTYVVQGLDKNGDGRFSREELAALAKENVESLNEFDYFTFGKIGGKRMVFDGPRDYWLEFDGKALTLHFLLPLKTAVPLRQAVFEVYDPSYYVEFKFHDEHAVGLDGAPLGCTALIKKPPVLDASAQQKLSEADVTAVDQDFAEGYANRAVVACP
jgi:ABC-type uncharacterized transport system substrate-binding protein